MPTLISKLTEGNTSKAFFALGPYRLPWAAWLYILFTALLSEWCDPHRWKRRLLTVAVFFGCDHYTKFAEARFLKRREANMASTEMNSENKPQLDFRVHHKSGIGDRT